MKAIGVDIGGTGIKAGVVDVETGKLVGERLRRPTPSPATRELLGAEIASLVADLDAPATLAVGVGFPAAVIGGVAYAAVNVGDDWLFADVRAVLGEAIERDVAVLNDCDAAGLAELHYGAARNEAGTFVMVTLGTGIGTSLFVNRTLVPNIELGGLAVRGKVAGERATNVIREGRGLSWKRWARDVELFLQAIDLAVTPRLIVVGGGVSDESHLFLPLVSARPPILPAVFRNDAGIVGAAAAAAAGRARQRGTADGMLQRVIASLALAPDQAGQARLRVGRCPLSDGDSVGRTARRDPPAAGRAAAAAIGLPVIVEVDVNCAAIVVIERPEKHQANDNQHHNREDNEHHRHVGGEPPR